jgi:hypothetical protein
MPGIIPITLLRGPSFRTFYKGQIILIKSREREREREGYLELFVHVSQSEYALVEFIQHLWLLVHIHHCLHLLHESTY